MLINVTTGKENFNSTSAKCNVFFVPSALFRAEKEVMLWQMAKGEGGAPHRVVQQNRRTHQAAPGYPREFGLLTQCDFDVPEGMVLKVWATRKNQELRAGRYVTAAAFMVVRETAPLIELRVLTNNDPRANTAVRVGIIGKLDLLTVDEARGLGVVPYYVGQHTEDNQGLLFRTSVIQAGTPAPVVPVVDVVQVTNARGERVDVVEHRPRRALDLG